MLPRVRLFRRLRALALAAWKLETVADSADRRRVRGFGPLGRPTECPTSRRRRRSSFLTNGARHHAFGTDARSMFQRLESRSFRRKTDSSRNQSRATATSPTREPCRSSGPRLQPTQTGRTGARVRRRSKTIRLRYDITVHSTVKRQVLKVPTPSTALHGIRTGRRSM